ncbi:hypothetical protein AAFF_G00343520 [Aldrovandia affinis]|uniref:TNFR-Cys domain-containing protein n=1 Tax=Aldrovandia affinis TaxID=143900 RepID=A0AAD7SL18_9TELE|nr:hypothetical protein AAFF_G00343520 [Aldrovandia affinis]
MENAVLSKMRFITIVVLCFQLNVVQSSECSTSEFQTEHKHCCRFSHPGYFITKNCTLREGVKSKECSKCTAGMGMETTTNCTTFSDTKCGCVDGYTMSSPGVCDPGTKIIYPNQVSTDSSALAAYVTVPIAAVLLMTMMIALFVMFSYRLYKARKTDMFLKVPCQV